MGKLRRKSSVILDIVSFALLEVLAIVLYFLSFKYEGDTFVWICIIPTLVLLLPTMFSEGFQFDVLLGSWIIACIVGFIIAFFYSKSALKLPTVIISSILLIIPIILDIRKLIKKEYV